VTFFPVTVRRRSSSAVKAQTTAVKAQKTLIEQIESAQWEQRSSWMP
jgi:hypothetical protein